MIDPELQEMLDELHRELDNNPNLEPANRREMKQVARELEALAAAKNFKKNPVDYLLGRLQTSASEFESEHPTLTAIVSRISNALSNIGV